MICYIDTHNLELLNLFNCDKNKYIDKEKMFHYYKDTY